MCVGVCICLPYLALVALRGTSPGPESYDYGIASYETYKISSPEGTGPYYLHDFSESAVKPTPPFYIDSPVVGGDIETGQLSLLGSFKHWASTIRTLSTRSVIEDFFILDGLTKTGKTTALKFLLPQVLLEHPPLAEVSSRLLCLALSFAHPVCPWSGATGHAAVLVLGPFGNFEGLELGDVGSSIARRVRRFCWLPQPWPTASYPRDAPVLVLETAEQCPQEKTCPCDGHHG